ncbi:MAG: S8 family serine peptidase [Gaiellaceae bacterium]
MAILSAAVTLAAPFGHIESGDPLYPSQWWYPRIGADLVEPPAPTVPVTLIDTGLDLAHPEFAGRPDTELLNEQSSGAAEAHGTAVASVLAAPANGVGVVGAFPRVSFRVWDASPRGLVSVRQIAAGLDAAAARGRGVVSISVGGSFREPILEQAVLNAFNRGVVVVSASGNAATEGNALSYPGALPHVLTVGATTRDDQPAIFSTRSRFVDVAAPGVEIPAAVSPDGYGLGEGTSYSAPMVAAAAAWIWSARPKLDKTQVVELIRRTARDLGAPGRDDDTGFGLLDLPAALAAAAPSADPQEPNDDVDQVAAGGRFAKAKAPLTRPGKLRATLRARLDVPEDPRDVYRIWIPAGRRVEVVARSTRDLRLAFRRRSGTVVARGTGRVAALNRTARGRYDYVEVKVPPTAGSDSAAYTLSVTTGPIRP